MPNLSRYSVKNVMFDGMEREYVMYTPSCANLQPLPLVFMFHGWQELAQVYAGIHGGWSDGFADVAEEKCFLTVWPQGTFDQLGRLPHASSWSAGGCSTKDNSDHFCDAEAVRRTSGAYCASSCGVDSCAACAWCACVDDVGFVLSLVDTLTQSLLVDAQHVYAAGCSNGAMLVYDLAADERSASRFAAFAADAGLPHRGHGCVPRLPVSLLHLHAHNDQVIALDGTPAHTGGWVYERLAEMQSALVDAAGCGVSMRGSGWAPLSMLNGTRGAAAAAVAATAADSATESSRELLQPLDAWLSPIRLQGVSARRARLESARCQIVSACGAEGGGIASDGVVALCAGAFAHDWPVWAAPVMWRFFEYVSALSDAGLVRAAGGSGRSVAGLSGWPKCASSIDQFAEASSGAVPAVFVVGASAGGNTTRAEKVTHSVLAVAGTMEIRLVYAAIAVSCILCALLACACLRTVPVQRRRLLNSEKPAPAPSVVELSVLSASPKKLTTRVF